MKKVFGTREIFGKKVYNMKVSDIRPEELMEGQKKAEESDIIWLEKRKKYFIEVSCPACGIKRNKFLYEKKSIKQVRCVNCFTQYASPRPTKKLLSEFYTNSKNYKYFAKYIFPASMEQRRLNLFKPRAEMVGKLAKKYGAQGGKLVEIGCGYGQFCEEIDALNVFDSIVGIEPTPELASICRKKNIEVLENSYENIFFDAPIDFIVHFEVIEHLFSPKDFINWCFGALKQGGYMIATCPSVAGLETEVLGKESNAVDHEHINLFSPDSMTILLKKCNFEVLEISTPGVLDLDLVRRAVKEERFKLDQLDPILKKIIFNTNTIIQEKSLLLLQEAHLTGNMLVVAKKPL